MGDSIAHVEETEKRLRSHKGVQGFIVMNGDGISVRSSMGNAETVHYAALVSRYVAKCRSCVKHLDGEDELEFVRIRSMKHEIMIAPDFSGGTDYYLVVVQNPTPE
jgi:dynein light chain roadblock-type